MRPYPPQKKYFSPLRSMENIAMVLICFTCLLSLEKIPGTNAYFNDSVKIEKNTFTAGYWIPEILATIDPAKPDGDDGWYNSTPCVTLSAKITDPENTKIFYSISSDKENFLENEKYGGKCVEIPDGQWNFSAHAIYDDNEKWKSNIISQDFKVETSGIQPGDVVINEVMWMGSKDNKKDQWVELKNVSNSDIHLKNWLLTYQSDNGKETELLKVKDNRIIKEGEFFLASYYTKNNSAINMNPDSNDLKNFGFKKFQLKLYTKTGMLMDVAGNGNEIPQKGDAEKFFSMQRAKDPTNGALWENWKTCFDTNSTFQYWDPGSTEQGTPGAENSFDETRSPEEPKKVEEKIATEIIPLEPSIPIEKKIIIPEILPGILEPQTEVAIETML